MVAFLCLLAQMGALLGTKGLLPAATYLRHLRAADTGGAPLWLHLPTLFWLNCSDRFMTVMAGAGLGISVLLMMGLANGIMLGFLWITYLSFVHIGQIFYGYGWEIMLLEACFLAIFLVPVMNAKPFASVPPSKVILWFYRWMIFRVMFGAGLIKLRGDPCWRDWTCLFYHFETQPIPNPISWYFHQLPPLLLKLGVAWNHLVELVVPFFLFGHRRLRIAGGWLLIGFQVFLVVSGNLSFLNWLTIALCVTTFDDRAVAALVPKRWRLTAARCARHPQAVGPARRIVIGCVAAVLAALSIGPIRNMVSPHQIMNTSFDPLHLVNTYGAFGHIGKKRYEIILQGTPDTDTGAGSGPEKEWREYEFRAKPGDVRRRPPFIAPYQPRLDWQIWFAAMSTIDQEPWLVHLIYKLLQNDPGVLRLLANHPFPQKPPAAIRAELYEYRFTRFGESEGAWWQRRRVGAYLQPVSLDDPGLTRYLRAYDLE